MSRVSLLQYLANEVVVRDIEHGEWAWSDTLEPEDLALRYAPHLEALQMQDHDWHLIFSQVEKWWHEQTVHSDDSERDKLWQEMVDRCGELPSYNETAEKLGVDIAETYLMNIECLESLPDAPDIGECGRSNRAFSKAEIEEITTLVSILAIGNKWDAVDEYEQHKRRLMRGKREKRDKLREQNEPFIERARSLQIWFPYPRQMNQWQTDVRTAPYYPLWTEMLSRVRKKLESESGVMQYIRKRRLTAKSATDLPRNMENMGRYLME